MILNIIIKAANIDKIYKRFFLSLYVTNTIGTVKIKKNNSLIIGQNKNTTHIFLPF